MSQQASYDRVMAQALRLLSLRSRTVAELRERLLDKGADSGAVEQVIARLRQLRYLNDEQFASDYSKVRLQTKPLGRRRLARELARKKVPPPIIEATLDQVYSVFREEALIDRAIQKHVRTRGHPHTRRQAKSLFDRLTRLGFDYELVRRKVCNVSSTSVDEGE